MNRCLVSLIIAILCVFSTSETLQATILTGSVSDLTGTPVTKSTFVRFQLANCNGSLPRVKGQSTVVATTKDIYPNGAGQLGGQVVGNDTITCDIQGNTFYKLTVWDSGRILYTGSYVISGSLFNLNSATPISNTPTAFVSAPGYAPGDILIATDPNTIGPLHGNSSPTAKVLVMSGNGTAPTTWSWVDPTVLPSGVIPAFRGDVSTAQGDTTTTVLAVGGQTASAVAAAAAAWSNPNTSNAPVKLTSGGKVPSNLLPGFSAPGLYTNDGAGNFTYTPTTTFDLAGAASAVNSKLALASNLGNGDVDNAHLSTIRNVTSDVQAQINSNATNIATNTTAVAGKLQSPGAVGIVQTTSTGSSTTTLPLNAASGIPQLDSSGHLLPAQANSNSGLTGAVDRTLQDVSKDVVSVKGFGAVGNGSTDDTVAIQKGLDAVYTSGACLIFPKGTYKTTNVKGFPTSTLDYRGECVRGDSKGGAYVVGAPGLDVFGHLDPSNPNYKAYLQDSDIRDLTIEVDASLDVSGQIWQATTTYTPVSGVVKVASNGGVWQVTTATSIITGTVAPTGTGPTASDGTVTWTYLSSTADSFYGRTTVNVNNNSPYNFPVGNCGIAIPRNDGALGGGPNHGYIQRNIFLQVHGANQANHTCGIYTQSAFNATDVSFNRFRMTYYGFVQAPPTTNVTATEFAPDGDNFTMDEYYNMVGHITYNDTHLVMTHPQIYASSLNSGTVYLLKVQSATRNAPGAVNVFDPYFETNSASTNIQAQWEGSGNVLIGGNMKQDSGSTSQIVWNVTGGKIIGTGIGNSISPGAVLVVNGSSNDITVGLQNVPDSSVIQNNGTMNRIAAASATGKEISFGDVPRRGIGSPSADTVGLGFSGTPIANMDDLEILLPENNSSIGVVQSDSLARMTGYKTSKVASPASWYSSNWRSGQLTIGGRIPQAKLVFWVYARASVATSQVWVIKTNTDNVTRASVSLSFGIGYSLQPMIVDLTTANAGDTLQIQANSTSPSADVFIGAMFFEPYARLFGGGLTLGDTLKSSVLNGAVQFGANGTLSLQSYAAGNEGLQSNVYYNGATTKYLTSGPGATVQLQNGSILFNLYPTGTAGANVSGTTVMRVLSGNTLSFGAANATTISATGAVATTGTINFANATATSPFQVGLIAAKPATCTVGQYYYSSDAPLGSNLSGCTALNTWSGVPTLDSGNHILVSQIPASLTSNTSGVAANITGVAGIVNGGTGQTTASAALTALGGVTPTQASVGAPINGATGSADTVLGQNACHSLTTGSQNVCFGTDANRSLTTGNSNISIGASAMYWMVTGTDNVAIGNAALNGNTAGSNNIAIGSSANSSASTASFDVAIGSASLAADSGGNNIALGAYALQFNTSGTGNVAIGPGAAGSKNTTGNNNTFLGNASGNNSVATIVNSTAIGASSQVSLSHQIMLGTSSENVYIPGSLIFPGTTSGQAQIGVSPVAGNPNPVLLPSTTGAPGTFLQTNGANPQVTSWAAAPVQTVATRTGNIVLSHTDISDWASATSGFSGGGTGTYQAPETGSVPTTFAIKADESLAVTNDFQAKGDGQVVVSGGAITVSTKALALPGAGFASSDVGKYIGVVGAGASGAVLVTTIAAFTDATHVTLTANAGTTVSSAYVSWGTDDTTAFQNALTHGAGKTILVPATGKRYIVGALTVPSNTRVLFMPGSMVQVKSGLTTNQVLFGMTAISNAEFLGQGATIYAPFPEYPSEYNHIFASIASSNITITGLTIDGAGGDGFYLADNGTTTFTSNVLIDHVTVNHVHRNGISIISAKHVTISNSTFSNDCCDGTTPSYPNPGLDVEPNTGSNVIQDINFENIYTTGNAGAGLTLAMGNLTSSTLPVSIRIRGFWSDGDGGGAIKTGCGPVSAFTGKLDLSDITSINAGSYGLDLRNWGVTCPVLEIKSPTIINPNSSVTAQEAIAAFGGGGNTFMYGNVDIKDATIIDNRGGSSKITNYYQVADYSNNGVSNVHFSAKTLVGATNGTATEGPQYSIEEPYLQTSATPIFDASLGTPNPYFSVTLNKNITSSTLINLIPGQLLTFDIHQTASYTYVMPTNVKGATTGTIASGKHRLQEFRVAPDGVTAYAIGAGVDD